LGCQWMTMAAAKRRLIPPLSWSEPELRNQQHKSAGCQELSGPKQLSALSKARQPSAKPDDGYERTVDRNDAWDGRDLAARPCLPGAWDCRIHQVSAFLRLQSQPRDNGHRLSFAMAFPPHPRSHNAAATDGPISGSDRKSGSGPGARHGHRVGREPGLLRSSGELRLWDRSLA